MSFVVSPIIRLAPHRYYGLLRLLIQLPLGFHLFGLYLLLERLLAVHRMRSLLFHHLLSQHPILPTPESSSRLFYRFFAASIAFAMRDRLGSLFFPFGSTCRCCKFHFMLRAAVLLPFLRELHRFSTTSHPAALDVCYMASW